MIHSNESQTFWELCEEFDESNKKDPVYLSVCMFLLRTVGGTMEGNMNFVISQRMKGQWFKFKSDSDIYKWLTERHNEADISVFEKKLSIFVD